MRSRNDTTLGQVDYDVVHEAASNSNRRSTKYIKYTDTDRFNIGKYASEFGTASAVRHYKPIFPKLVESSVRSFKTKYESQLEAEKKSGATPSKAISLKPKGRPLLMGPFDSMVQKYIQSMINRGAVITWAVANAAAKALMRKYPGMIGNIDIDSSSWAQSLFRRMGYVKRRKTSSKVDIPDAARKEIEYVFLYEIVNRVEKHDIPKSLIINLDQTPLKLVQCGNNTLAKKNTSKVTIAGSADKRSITATFAVTLAGNFLPMQLIYGGKTEKSLPRYKFPKGFSLSVNPKHFSNTAESIKLLNEIIVPYVKKQRLDLGLSPTQKALVIMDVFTGQMTSEVTKILADNDILVTKVPANMTRFYQPLDLTVNGNAKRFMAKKFNNWYSEKISEQLESGKCLEDVDVKLRLSTLKPIHAGWIVDFYNYITSEEGRKVIESGWQAAGIADAVQLGLKALPSLDPFHDIDPLIDGCQFDVSNDVNAVCNLTTEQIEGYQKDAEENENDDENDEDVWVLPEKQRSAFDIFANFDDEENL